MAKDHNKYGNMDNNNPKVLLVKAENKKGEPCIVTK
jgi:hypothetical protein